VRPRGRSALATFVLGFVVVMAVIAGGASVARARPGGGQSFSGGSSSSGSSYRPSGSSSSGSSWSSGGSSWSSSGSSNSTSSRSNDSSWSTSPSYSAPWTSPQTSPTYHSEYPSSSDPSYSRSSGSLLEFYFWILVVVAVVVIVVVVGRALESRRLSAWSSGIPNAWVEAEAAFDPKKEAALARNPTYASVELALQGIAAKDDAFSFVVFEDFLYALYAELHTLRGKRKIEWAAPYLSEAAKTWFANDYCDSVSAIIVGAIHIEEVRVDTVDRRIKVRAKITANYCDRTADRSTDFYAEDEWTLSRNADVKSRKLDAARVIGCPECGAPLDKQVAAKCGSCGAAASNPDLDWRVDAIRQLAKEPRGPILVGTTQEVGNDFPTIIAPDAKRRFAELLQADPSLTWQKIVARIEQIFKTFHQTWTAQELGPVRPFLTDALYETQQYWVHAYQAEKLRNVTREPTLMSVQCAKVSRDRYFEAITVRIYASCYDSTIDANEKVVGGDPNKVRHYTEYWTLIRAKDRKPAVDGAFECPNCGAPFEGLGEAGKCAKCGVTIRTSTFDWVLSRIEQDDAYEG